MTPASGFSVPASFEPMGSRGPFTQETGPFYRSREHRNDFGFLPETRHCNGLGFVHGGMIATFLDNAMAQTVATEHRCVLVTAELHVSYENLVPRGRWAQARVELDAARDDHVRASVELTCRAQCCATASGLYKLFRHRPL